MRTRQGIELELALAPDEPSRLTLPHWFEDVSSRFASRVALRFEGVDSSYAELADRAGRMAAALRAMGVAPGERVAVLIANRPEWVTAVFGAARIGGIVVPISTFATPDERDYILRHSDARFLLMQRHLVGRDFVSELSQLYPGITGAPAGRLELDELPELRGIASIDADGAIPAIEPWESFLERGAGIDEEQIQPIADAIDPDDSGLIIYTSGTTDRPKGVLHAQKAAVIQSWRFGELLGLVPEDVVLTAQPFFWTAGICMSLGATLSVGAKLLLQESFDPEAALECAEKDRATTLYAWAHQEKAMAEHPSAQGRDFTALHRIESDSPLAPLAGIERDAWGIHSSYGMTETFTLVSAQPAWAPASDRKGNSGRALPGMEIGIIDPEGGAPLAVGLRGEIIVRGVTLMQGYWKVPLENVLDGEGYFHTGDGGYLDAEGLLHWTGRLSGMIKTGGANVSPLEVEKVAAEQPGVRAAIAVGLPHPTLGEALVLCVVPTEGSVVDENDLIARLRERLARYKVPRHVLVVEEAEAPTTGTQKLRADALRTLALDRMAAGRVEVAGHVYGG